MSQVLRKKIMSATGVPQSLLRMPAFWDQLRATFGAWSLEYFGTELRPVFDTRRVISGKAALEVLADSVSYKFPSDDVSGFSAMALDASCVALYSATRLKETVGGVQSASPLLLKLVCEEIAVGLRKRVASGFGKTGTGPWQLPVESAQPVAGQFAATTRYLLVGARLPLPSEPIQVSLIFHLDQVQQNARASTAAAASRAAQAHRHTPDALRNSVRKSSVDIQAVLERLTMSVGDCSRLTIGQVLELPGAGLERLSLCAETITGSMTVGQGELGVWKHNRAIKLGAPINPGFIRNIAEL